MSAFFAIYLLLLTALVILVVNDWDGNGPGGMA